MNGPLLIWLGYVAFVIALIAGWVMNIITIAHSSFNDITGMLILRVVGIFVAPLGSILGYI